MRKTIVYLILTALLIGMFAGCSSTGTQNATAAATTAAAATAAAGTTAAAATAAAATAAATTAAATTAVGSGAAAGGNTFHETGYPIFDETVTFTAFNSWDTSASEWGDNQALFRAMRDLTNIDWDFKNIPSTDFDNKLNLSFAAGELADFYPSWTSSTIIYNNGVKGGQLVEFSDKIETYMPYLVMLESTYPDILKIVTQTDGGIYSFPQIVYTATAGNGNVYVRTDYMEEAGISEEPATVTDFYDMLVAMQNTVGQRIEGFIPYLPYSVVHLNGDNEKMLFAAMGDYIDSGFDLDANGKVIYAGATEQMQRYLAFMNKLFSEKLLNNEVYTMEPATALAMIQTGQAGVTTYGTVMSMDSFPSGHYDVSLLAPMTSEYSSKQKIIAQMPVSDSTRCISTSCEYPEAILRWVDILYSQDDVAPGLNAISSWLGIRGETWDFTDDTHQFYARLAPEGTENINVWVTSYASPQTHYGLNFMAIANDASEGLKVKGLGYIAKHLPYEVTPFPQKYLKFNDADTERYQNLWVDLSAYIDEMKAKFITGVESVDKFDEFTANLEKMKLSEVCEIMQRGYDAYVGQ